MVIYRFNSFHCLTRSSSRHHLPSTHKIHDSSTFHGIICARLSGSFAIEDQLRSGDHFRYCTVLESSSGLIRHRLPKHKIVLIPGWSHRGVCDAYCTIWGSILLSGHLPEATAESSHFKWSLTVGSTVRCAYAGWSSHLYNLKLNLLLKFCSNDRWNHLDLLIKKLSSHPPTENATFSWKTSRNACFNLTCNHAPRHTGISNFFLSWWSIPHPQEQRNRQFPTLEPSYPSHPSHSSQPSHPTHPRHPSHPCHPSLHGHLSHPSHRSHPSGFFLVVLSGSKAALPDVGSCTFMEYYCAARKCSTNFIKGLQRDPNGSCRYSIKVVSERMP